MNGSFDICDLWFATAGMCMRIWPRGIRVGLMLKPRIKHVGPSTCVVVSLEVAKKS